MIDDRPRQAFYEACSMAWWAFEAENNTMRLCQLYTRNNDGLKRRTRSQHVRLSQDSDGRLVDHSSYVLQHALPLLHGLEAASTAAGMLAEYEEDLKMALCQTDDEGSTVMAKLLQYDHRPSLKLVEYLLSHGT
jgi:hypothetical protein